MSETIMTAPAARARRGGGSGTFSRGHLFLLGLVLLLALLFAWAGVRHRHRTLEAEAAARVRAAPLMRLHVVQLEREHAPTELELPGTIAPLETASLGARATGYVARRTVDIGSVVKSGQLLAVIRSRELDQQLSQARATLLQSRANRDLARVTAARSQQLVQEAAIPVQQWDNDRLIHDAREADMQAAAAALGAAQQRRDYLDVVAPFAGVVTARNVEAGDLVRADDASAKPLFVISRTDVARVQVSVPQDAADSVHVGDPIVLTVQELPGRTFPGRVARTSTALDAGSRTLATEVELDNRQGLLKAGTYIRVRFSAPPHKGGVFIPAEAFIYDEHGLQVAVADGDRVRKRRIAVGRDEGTRIEVRSGLQGNERVVVNPPSSLEDGQRVEIVQDKPAPAAP